MSTNVYKNRFGIFLLIFLLVFCSFSLLAKAHSGGTDSKGGHYNRSTGEYHYHHGYPAHQHTDLDGDGVLDCPYEYKDNTTRNHSATQTTKSTFSDKTSPHKALWIFFILENSAFALIIFKIVHKKKKEKKIETERLDAEKRKDELEKAELIRHIAGRPLREVAGVPENIRFLSNGWPVDNNDSQFGSFTVYMSSSGIYYHKKPGCASAFYSIHIFNATEKKLKPCPKCCQNPFHFPSWFLEYEELVKKCKNYNIPTNDN